MPGRDRSRSRHPLVNLALEQIDRAYDARSWHGTGLKGALRGVSAETALWRPDPERRSINEQALHAAYWKYTVRRRLRGEKRGAFPLPGSNWFERAGPVDDARWRDDVALLESIHRELREAVATLDDASLTVATSAPPGVATGRATALDLVLGVAAHDLYHAGQIQLLKRLAGA